MTDDVDTAQLKLEGRCICCKEKLPKHLETCKKHPRFEFLKGIKNLHNFINTQLNSLEEQAKDPEKRRFLEEYITKSKK